MNKTINISLPKNLANLAQAQVDAGYFSSVSEVIRDALRNKLMSPAVPTIQMSEKAMKVAEKAEEEYKAGKVRLLKDVDDLDSLL